MNRIRISPQTDIFNTLALGANFDGLLRIDRVARCRPTIISARTVYTLVGGQSKVLDLGAVPGIDVLALRFTAITGILVRALAGNVSDVTIEPNATHPFTAPFAGAEDILGVTAGSSVYFRCKDTAGWPVIEDAADKLKITNTSSTSAAAVEVLVLGDATALTAVEDSAFSSPGHYMQVLPATDDSVAVDAANSSSAVVGAQPFWYWHELEPTEGNYNFAVVEALLDALAVTNKKMAFFISDKAFNAGYHPLPQYLRDAGIEYAYTPALTGLTSYMTARWDPLWAERYAALINAFQTEFDGHAAFEGICTEESGLTDYGYISNGLAYSIDLYAANLISVFTNTFATRPHSWLFWFLNFMNPAQKRIEVPAFQSIIDATYQKRVAFGGPNARMWPDNAPTDADGWSNPVWRRPYTNILPYVYAKEPRPRMFLSFQPSEFKKTNTSPFFNPRDLEYGFDRLVHNTETTGTYGDNGAWDWGDAIDTIFWLYQPGATSSVWKFNHSDHVLPIIEAHPTWYTDGTPAYQMNAMGFPGTCRLRRESSTGKPASSGKFVAAVWLKMGATSVNASSYPILEGRTAGGVRRFAIERGADGAVQVFAASSAGVALLDSLAAGSVVTADAGWKCLMISGDRTANRLQVYAGDTQLYDGPWSSAAADIDFNGCTRWTVGGDWDGTAHLLAELGQLYLDTTRTVDLSQKKLRRSMYSEVGKPIFPGSDGHRYMIADVMTQPPIYMGNPDDADDWNVGGALNRGSYDTAGVWTKVGSGSIAIGTPP